MYCAPVMAPVAAPLLGVSPAAVGYFVTTAYLGSMIGTATAGGWVERFGPIRVSQAGMPCAVADWPLLRAAPARGAGRSPPRRPRLRSGHAGELRDPRAYRAPRHAFADLLDQADRRAARHGHRGRDGTASGARLGWQWAALAVGAVCALFGLAITPLRDAYDSGRNRSAPVSLHSALAPVLLVLREPSIMPLAATSFVYGGVQITLVAYLVAFLTESFALSLVLAGIVMAASQLASVAGRVLWGILADRVLGRRAARHAGRRNGHHRSLPRARRRPPLAAMGAVRLRRRARRYGGGTACFSPSSTRLAPPGRIGDVTGGSSFFTFLGVVVTPPLFISRSASRLPTALPMRCSDPSPRRGRRAAPER